MAGAQLCCDQAALQGVTARRIRDTAGAPLSPQPVYVQVDSLRPGCVRGCVMGWGWGAKWPLCSRSVPWPAAQALCCAQERTPGPWPHWVRPTRDLSAQAVSRDLFKGNMCPSCPRPATGAHCTALTPHRPGGPPGASVCWATEGQEPGPGPGKLQCVLRPRGHQRLKQPGQSKEVSALRSPLGPGPPGVGGLPDGQRL